MRRYTRIVFGLNALYQIALGFLCLLTPAVVVGMYGGTGGDEHSTLMLVCFRLLGVNLVPIGVICALVGINPDSHPILRQLMGLLSILTLIGWGIVKPKRDFPGLHRELMKRGLLSAPGKEASPQPAKPDDLARTVTRIRALMGEVESKRANSFCVPVTVSRP